MCGDAENDWRTEHLKPQAFRLKWLAPNQIFSILPTRQARAAVPRWQVPNFNPDAPHDFSPDRTQDSMTADGIPLYAIARR